MAAPRYLEKATSVDGLTTAVFPTNLMEYEPSQRIRRVRAVAGGASYGLDLTGGQPAPKDFGREVVRFTVFEDPLAIDAVIDALAWKLYLLGRLKLWQVNASGARRWCYATLDEMPSVRISTPFMVPASLSFTRESDWFGETAIEDDATATGTVVITNLGLEAVYHAELILKGTYTNPVITNTTNGYKIETARDGSDAGHWLRVDAGRHEVQFSSDGGDTYADDFANYVRQAGQGQLMVLEPGDNELTFSGVSSATLAWRFFAAYQR